MAIPKPLPPSAPSSTLPLVQDTVFMEEVIRRDASVAVLDEIGEWPPSVWKDNVDDSGITEKKWYHRNDVAVDIGLTFSERRTPLPLDDPGIDQGFMLPGEDPGELKFDCGQVNGVLWCESCNPSKKEFVGEKKKSCTNRLCPECYTHWLHRQSDSLADRLYQFRRAVGYSGRHVMFSASPDDRFLPIKELKEKFYELSDLAGIVASVVVTHVWRFRELNGREVAWKWCSLNPDAQKNIDHRNTEFDAGAFKTPAPSVEPIPCRRFYWPHFHMVAWGWIMDQKDFQKISNGWIYKNIDDKGPGRSNRQDMYRSVRYMLSHAAIRKGNQTYTLRGLLHYTKWDIEKDWTDQEEMLCEVCETPLVLIHVKSCGRLGLEEPALKLVNMRLFWWKKGRPPEGWRNGFKPPDVEDGLDFTGIDAPAIEVEFVELE